MKTTALKTLSLICVSFGLMTAVPNSASAQSAEEIMKRAKEIKEFKDMLNHADETVRLAALDAMLSSKDLAMRELAYSAGFASVDDTMRAIALRKKIAETGELNIELSITADDEKQFKSYISNFGKNRTLRVQNYSINNGNFNARFIRYENHQSAGQGSISGLRLDASQDNCYISTTLNDESVLEGTLTCRGYKDASVPIKINVI
ncbi:hypothetical protein [Pseudidiomarina insulisalsae]|uniref:DUF4252 domain-containing protein n=1 Tax=Pseudidiomarina insulisalsae TaxID=575789 RepID=A0A432YLD8_9GAMM|nr:hypothetical protein [Pseudidiomarina insulisalsae]RUO61799.1 hypothetical protein CWI71_05410 [Pseudidiomarina insulisalsae]